MTLQEVIRFFEKQEVIDKWQPRTDALSYLKEYEKLLPLLPSLIIDAQRNEKKGKTIG